MRLSHGIESTTFTTREVIGGIIRGFLPLLTVFAMAAVLSVIPFITDIALRFATAETYFLIFIFAASACLLFAWRLMLALLEAVIILPAILVCVFRNPPSTREDS